MTYISSRYVVMSSGTHCERTSWSAQRIGVGEVFIAGCGAMPKRHRCWPPGRYGAWPDGWTRSNAPQTEAELAAVRRTVNRGCPFGEIAWSDRVVARLGLESTLRPQGRPRKQENGS